MPISTVETINVMLRKLVYGRHSKYPPLYVFRYFLLQSLLGISLYNIKLMALVVPIGVAWNLSLLLSEEWVKLNTILMLITKSQKDNCPEIFQIVKNSY